jgi:hypothetical protein
MVDHSKRDLNEEYYQQFVAAVCHDKVIVRKSSECDVVPSVTNILNATMSEKSKAALENWKRSMIEKMGEDGFNEYSRGKIRVFKTYSSYYTYILLHCGLFRCFTTHVKVSSSYHLYIYSYIHIDALEKCYISLYK